MSGGVEFVAQGDQQRVQAWSVRRLPFEPKGAMVDLRAAIRTQLACLDPSPTGLHCVYSSEDADFCDAENVLLYNVGMSSFGQLIENGVTIERSYDVPPAPAPMSGPALHHLDYAVPQREAFEHWVVDTTVVAWLGRIPAREAKAADWWWATQSALAPAGAPDLTGVSFGLQVSIGPTRRTTASLLKPMLDGVIAALHHDPDPDHEAVVRLARYLDQPESAIHSQLASGPSPLGPRRVVRVYRSGLQWDPADDLCVACRVERLQGPGAGRFEGRLTAVAARCHD